MLVLSNLKAGYGSKTVIELANLSVKAGGKCLITGASGSGKTTLLYTVAGLAEPQKGSIQINGTDLYTLNDAARDRFRGDHIGIIFQSLHLVKSLNVLENILLSPFVNARAQDTSYANYLLERLGVAALKDRAATDISQGQAQRVAIARALLNKPSLLLADEPTSSLDDKAAFSVMDLLRELVEETQTTLIVSSHDERIKACFEQHVSVKSAS